MASGISLFSVLAAGLYALAGAMSLRAWLTPSGGSKRPNRGFWFVLAAFFAFLAVSRLFGIEAGLTAGLRSELKAQMLYRGRAEIQGIIASVVIVTASAIIAVWLWRRTRTPWRAIAPADRYRMAAEVACGAIVCLVMLRVVSLHMVDSVLYRGPHLNWVVDIGATLAVIVCSIGYTRANGRASQAAGRDKPANRRRQP